MKAAAAARGWWAAFRRRTPESRAQAALRAAASHVSSYVLMALAVAMLACAVAGFAVTVREDQRLAAERHAALELALDEVRGVFGDSDGFDDSRLPLVARLAGLKDLRFDTDEDSTAGREAQSLHDERGRIVGWFSWAADRSLIRAEIWLWGLIGAVGAALGVCAFVAAGLIQRLARLLASSLKTIRKLTREDALTGLPNHRVMLESLDRALARRRSGVVVLALIDIEGFREVNDTHGRSGGDALLKSIAERLHGSLPAGAQFGRFDDDEFAVIMSSDDTQTASLLAEALRASLQRPIFMEQNWQFSAGIGSAQAPDDGSSADELSRRANLALRAAKREGRGMVRRFEPYIEMEYSEQRFIRRELESALSAGGLDVHYQPVVAAAGGAMIGVEALLRWTHPTRGAIGPSVFVPLAEQSGLMPQLGEFVLRRALSDGVRWPNLTVAVNLSPIQIRDRKLVDLVARRHCRKRHRAVARHLRSDRRRAHRRSAGDLAAARSIARARRQYRARRFRHRLFELELSAKIPVQPDQDRPRLRRLAGHHRPCRRHHPIHRRARSRARHESLGRRCRDRRAARAAAARRL